nr:class I SAM-dependent methyltransferase [Vampirovibrio sp.]
EVYFAELVKGLYVTNYETAKALAELLDIGGKEQGLNILDVAGGSAVWSIAMLERDAGSRATLLDYPMVIHVGESYVEKHGLQDRYEYYPGDLEELELPQNQYDMAILANICHAIGPHTTQNLFDKVFQTLKPGGKAVIIDFVPDDERSKPGWPLIFGVNMLISTQEGDVYTDAQYRQWLGEKGFQSIKTHSLDSEVTVLVAEK